MNHAESVWIICVLVVASSWIVDASPTCVECSSTNDSVNCAADNFVLYIEQVKTVDCQLGACYSTVETIKGAVESMRGCTNDLEDMPFTIPPEGAYTWHGKTITVCTGDLCNVLPPEQSSRKSIYSYEKETVNTDDRGPIDCFQCMNYDENGNSYPQCSKHKRVDIKKAYAEKCNSTCFIKTFGDDPKRIARGCADTQWGLPYPLPPDGCYNWENGVWCVCNGDGCNGRPIGKSSGKELDDHLYAEGKYENFEEKDGLNRCFECINYDAKGTYYKQCPKHKRVRNAFLSVCNGSCFTHSYDYDDKKVARGCTGTQWGLPDPLPPDGCYKWYSEVWCVCSKTRCNRHPIGEAQDIEFDAHIKKNSESKGTPLYSSEYLVMSSCLFLFLFRLPLLRHFNNDDWQ